MMTYAENFVRQDPPSLPWMGKADRFKRENQVNRGFIVKFERVDFLQSDIGLIQRAFGGLRCGGIRQELGTVMDRELGRRVRGHQDPDRRRGNVRRNAVLARDDNRGGAVAELRQVEHAERRQRDSLPVVDVGEIGRAHV